MNRRALMALLGVATAAWPRVARMQPDEQWVGSIGITEDAAKLG
jgi:hypothetical protein